MFWLLISISAITHAINEIGKHRKAWTWLPDWLFGTGGLINLDGYHIVKGVSRVTLFWAGYFFPYAPETFWQIAGNAIWVWFVDGNIMDLFYHTFLMKKKHWQFGLGIWLSELKELLFGRKKDY